MNGHAYSARRLAILCSQEFKTDKVLSFCYATVTVMWMHVAITERSNKAFVFLALTMFLWLLFLRTLARAGLWQARLDVAKEAVRAEEYAIKRRRPF